MDSERSIRLTKTGTYDGKLYLGVFEGGQFKTLRADRVLRVDQLSGGHTQSIKPILDYHQELPPWLGLKGSIRVPQSAGTRTWGVHLEGYSCTCPEGRIRAGMGYAPGMLGGVCPHLAKAILANMPPDAAWNPELLLTLADEDKTSIAALL